MPEDAPSPDAQPGDAMPADAPTPDAQPRDAALDAGPSDVGPNACSRPPLVDPMSVAVDSAAASRSSDTCVPCNGNQTYLYPFVLTSPRQVTLYYSHTLAWRNTDSYGLIEGCSPTGRCLLTGGLVCGIQTILLQPGTYAYVGCSSLNSAQMRNIIEAPPPAASNTSCATALTLPLDFTQSYHERRIADGADRYYQFATTMGVTATRLTLTNTMGAGEYYHISIRRVCNDPTSQIASTNRGSLCAPGFPSPTDELTFDTPSVGTYYVVISNIPRGIDWNVSLRPCFGTCPP
jgi:hypothetical protein